MKGPKKLATVPYPNRDVILERLDKVRAMVESGEVSELLMVFGDRSGSYDGWWSPSPNTYGLLGFAIGMTAYRCMSGVPRE